MAKEKIPEAPLDPLDVAQRRIKELEVELDAAERTIANRGVSLDNCNAERRTLERLLRVHEEYMQILHVLTLR